MYIDTHVHYNLSPLSNNWQKYWQEAQCRNVSKSLIVGTNLETSKLAVKIADQDKNLFASIGIHPHNAINFSETEFINLAKSQSVTAIGEIGLDYFRLNKNKPETQDIINQQKKSFTDQIIIAKKLSLPLVIHVRDKETPKDITKNNAYWDSLEILENQLHTSNLNFILHCASGPLKYIDKALSMGAYIGFDGNITYKNANHIRKILKIVPKNRVLLETDAPYLPPEPHRGKVCEPWMVSLTGKYLNDNFRISEKQLELNSLILTP